MWLDELKKGESWIGVWKNKIHCPNCMAIFDGSKCPVCYYELKFENEIFIDNKGIEHRINSSFVGAIDWSIYVILSLMQQEWERPLLVDQSLKILGNELPQHILIPILFWSLFENLIDHLFRDGLKYLPPNISNDLLKRYSSIGSRLDRLYKIAFPASFKGGSRKGWIRVY